ncbi:hypothetical protein K469DRAFT_23481 [Zopfia rhizophila CBS 207.26]|uniref:Uncharacterized protein n=1 Tax=Zopfia rhizophila CBS 207.26 TaxID=1314779 RepID=A0A6A6EED3_9PEZI|nr:hypothetical protein K469DRAFT_23481 [Zopfia rhizophila CBS 207.26]
MAVPVGTVALSTEDGCVSSGAHSVDTCSDPAANASVATATDEHIKRTKNAVPSAGEPTSPPSADLEQTSADTIIIASNERAILSRAHTSVHPQAGAIETAAEISNESYLKRVDSLSRRMTHLHDLSLLLDRSTISLAKVDVIENFRGGNCDHHGFNQHTKNLLTHLSDESNVQSRIIIVEGLSAEALNVLGERYHIDPEFFAHHLVGDPHKPNNGQQASSRSRI